MYLNFDNILDEFEIQLKGNKYRVRRASVKELLSVAQKSDDNTNDTGFSYVFNFVKEHSDIPEEVLNECVPEVLSGIQMAILGYVRSQKDLDGKISFEKEVVESDNSKKP